MQCYACSTLYVCSKIQLTNVMLPMGEKSYPLSPSRVVPIYSDIHNVGYTGNSDQSGGIATFEYLDSPATTSATTYKLQAARNYGVSGSSFTINTTFDSQATGSSITLMEIAG